jgi:predicted dinucleotide-binding enzyme
MQITIIGAGNVGAALGIAFIKQGHEVTFGLHNPENSKYNDLKKESGADFTTVALAVKKSGVILLAVPWKSVHEIIGSIENWEDKILVDCTNPIVTDFSGLATGEVTSGAELIASWANGARVVKCFNQTGYENMKNPEFMSGKSMMFSAGDDDEAVEIVTSLANQIGFEALAIGPLHMAKQLEQLALLWIHLAFKVKLGRGIGFGLLHRL